MDREVEDKTEKILKHLYESKNLKTTEEEILKAIYFTGSGR